MARAKPSMTDMEIETPGAPIADAGVSDLAAEGGGRATINLTVTEDLKYEFKEWCVRHRISQVKAFRKAFDILKEREGP